MLKMSYELAIDKRQKNRFQKNMNADPNLNQFYQDLREAHLAWTNSGSTKDYGLSGISLNT